MEFSLIALPSLSPSERNRLIKKAHETLVDSDERNAAKFGPLLAMLADEIEKFELKDASPMEVKIKSFTPNAKEGEATATTEERGALRPGQDPEAVPPLENCCV